MRTGVCPRHWILTAGALVLTAGVPASSPGAQGPDSATMPVFDPDMADGVRARAAIDYFESYFDATYFSKGRALDEMKHTGYLPYVRTRYFWEQHRDETGAVHPARRWDAYRASKARLLEDGAYRLTASWASLGPNTMTGNGGRLLCHAFHPNDPQTIYAGSNSGGLWKTTNGAQSWEPVTDQLPSMRVSSVAINPQNPDEMLIGTGAGWAVTIALLPGVGVLRSEDGGMTWSPTGFAYPFNESNGVSTYDLVWDPVDPNRVHLAATNGLWLSTDSGESWTLKLSGECSAVILANSSPNVVFAAVQGQGIYKSTNSGDSYSLLSGGGLPPGGQFHQTSLTVCESFPNTLYAAIADPVSLGLLGLYRTDDGGQTWTPIPNVPNFLCQPSSTSCVGWLFNAIGVSPVDPDLLLCGGVQLWRTDDGGATWTWHDYLSNGATGGNDGLAYVDFFGFGFEPGNPGTVYAFNDGGCFKSLNAGQLWDQANTDLVTGMFYRIASAETDGNQIIGGTQDHGLHKLDHTDGNLEWTRWTTNDGAAVNVDHTNANIIYGDVFFGIHYKSFTGASTYEPNPLQIMNGINETGAIIAPTVMDPEVANVLYTASVSKIYKTVSGGSFWITKADIPNVRTLAIDRVNPDVIYAHAYDNSTWQLWRSSDSGDSWSQITHPTIPTWRVTDMETDPSNEGVIYATRNSAFSGSDHVKKSTDHGSTWVDVTNNLPDVFTNAIAISPFTPEHVYLATDLGVYLSTDAGATWQEWNDGLPLVYASDIHYHASTRTIRVATIGRGVWMSPAADAEVTAVADTLPAHDPAFAVLDASPNPSHGETKVRYRLDVPGRVEIRIFNALGQAIDTIASAEMPAGVHRVTWGGRNARGDTVPAGTYFVRVSVGRVAQSRRVVRLR